MANSAPSPLRKTLPQIPLKHFAEKPLPLPPPRPSRFRSVLWTVVFPLTIAFYLSFLYAYVSYHRDSENGVNDLNCPISTNDPASVKINTNPSSSTNAPCSPTSHHCWGPVSPHTPPLRGSGPRDRTQLGASNATLLMLVRNSELSDALNSIRQIEDRFNRHYRYPWTFLNDEEFTEEFRLYTSIMVSGEVRYARVEGEEWGRGEGVREENVRMGMESLEQDGVVYARSESYRNMCRWFAGRFMWHEAVRGFEWYWRVEPNIRYPCDLLYDPFDFLASHHKSFSFTIALPDYPSTLRSLLPTLQSFFRQHPTLLHPNATTSLLPFFLENPELQLSSTPGPNTTASPLTFLLHPSTTLTYCHFWSNFELGPLSFFRSTSYTTLFNFLDATGNFHHERWGDAPVHTAAVATLLGSEEVHFWRDVGYWHSPLGRCPWDEDSWESGRCGGCQWVGEASADWGGGSGGCLRRWWETVGMGGWWDEFSKFEEELGGL